MKRPLIFVVLFVLLLGAGFVTVKFYPYLFAKTVNGEIVKVERVTHPSMVINNAPADQAVPAAQLYSYAVSVRDDQGEIHTASSEDRQWAVAQAGQCANAKFFPYPPWDLDKAGTFHGARLLSLHECTKSALQN